LEKDANMQNLNVIQTKQSNKNNKQSNQTKDLKPKVNNPLLYDSDEDT